MKRYAYIPLVTMMASCAVFSGKKSKKTTAPTVAAAPAAPAVPYSKAGVKPYNNVVVKSMQTKEGLITVHTTPEFDSVYFEIGKNLLNRDILVVNRLLSIGGGLEAYAGEEVNNQMIYFEKGKGENIVMRYNMVISVANPDNDIFRAVQISNGNPILATFPIKAYGKDSNSYVVDATKFLKDPQSIINATAPTNKSFDGKMMKDNDVTYIRTYPNNIEIGTIKNGNAKVNGNKPLTVETSSSFVLLPEKPMQRRVRDQRVGFFYDDLVKFSDKQQAAEKQSYITRWKLEPKPQDVEKYKRGELVEPANPILYYIDPATPKQWRKYLIAGVNDWQKAFEKAGFKNAISAKEWPENDTSMHMDDVRYSFINYFASEIPNAYGPNVHDPRSGEIIQSHIGWYHNVMTLVHDWYQLQAGPNDPEARYAVFNEELMGQLIRFVSSHEIGHTLGLLHNFGSSSKTPVDSLRSISYLTKYGHTASIMDYARFNYVAQPSDKIPQALLFPRINDYDEWAIEFGYKNTFAKDEEEDKVIMRRLVTKRLAENDRLWWGDGEMTKFDPRCQTEDLSDNAAKASTYGINNLKIVVQNLPKWTMEENGQREVYRRMYKQVIGQYNRYVNHVFRYVGAVQYDVRTNEDTRPVMTPVSKETQLASLDWINKEVFTTPTWLAAPAVQDQVLVIGEQDDVRALQVKVLNSALDAGSLNVVANLYSRYGSKAISVDEYLEKLRVVIWGDLNSGSVKVASEQRALQKAYIGALYTTIKNIKPEIAETEAASISYGESKRIYSIIKNAIPRTGDASTKAHLESLVAKIDALNKN
ncbi:uncharacterized protein DUF5118 [Chitinophaga skermanii]|uniref:Uncharacterized protein DUF5118 n=1 Tax=Chitinophaga skermanii TaxID=331697 RepID=A0A327QZI1_9BACT|nr:zinc-dependent metalloprotease [Chitinophaga skermanii]RAJ08853.1 uncharacterized protein DUF5118 [Chitinophaga skermanii]